MVTMVSFRARKSRDLKVVQFHTFVAPVTLTYFDPKHSQTPDTRLGFCNAASRATDFLGIFADGANCEKCPVWEGSFQYQITSWSWVRCGKFPFDLRQPLVHWFHCHDLYGLPVRLVKLQTSTKFQSAQDVHHPKYLAPAV